MKDKRNLTHSLTRQGTQTPDIGDFVLIKDDRNFNYIKYGIIMDFSPNKTKALVRTKKEKKVGWYIMPLILVKNQDS